MIRPVLAALGACLALVALAPLAAQPAAPPSQPPPPPAAPPSIPTQPGVQPQQGKGAPLIRATLDNGVNLLIQPIPDCGRVAVVAIYDTGLLDNPAGQPQALHLVEHLVCFGPTDASPRDAAWNELSAAGVVGAETLADWVHYDYCVPPDRFERVLQLHAERLASLRPDVELLAREAPRAAAEVDAVASSALQPLVKFAFAAAQQAWWHGQDRVLLRSALDSAGADALLRLFADTHRPDRLLLVIAGDVEPQRAVDAAQVFFAGITRPQAPPRAAPDWPALPDLVRVQWDVDARAVLLAYPPPDDPADRLLLTVFGSVLTNKLNRDEEVRRVARFVAATEQGWNVGRLPFFVYASAREGVSCEELARVLAERIDVRVPQSPSRNEHQQIRAFVMRMSGPPQISASTIDQLADQAVAARGIDRDKALDLVLGNTGIQLALRYRLLGDQPVGAGMPITRLSPEQMHGSLQRLLAPERRFAVHLAPVDPSPDAPPATPGAAPADPARPGP